MGTIRECHKINFQEFGMRGETVDFPNIGSVCLVDDIEQQITKVLWERRRDFLGIVNPCFLHSIESYPDSHHME